MSAALSRLIWMVVLGFGLVSLGFAAEPTGPVIEPVAPITQETRSEFKIPLQAKGDGPLAYRVVEVRHADEVTPTPKGLALAADSGVLTWVPTPSQAGAYEITVGVKDKEGTETKATVKLTVTAASISKANGAVGDLLRKWASEGTAAGNTGDFYDNRDRDHSALNLQPYPQLDVVTYTPEERKINQDWAMQVVLRPMITFGNSSTSAPVQFGGSNVRSYYVHPRGLPFLYEEYRHNNLYMYPAHHDHHPGHHGDPFYGDVFPANSPYLITSQGSSGTDQPFMNAVPKTLAAFRPDVKKKLAAEGLLMPTVQMIFRASNKHLTDPKDYLSGKAHPPVFEGSWVDELKMVQMAHDIKVNTLPPLVQLKVIEEDVSLPGRDYFEADLGEKIADSPCAIARVVRGMSYEHRMVVSAADSIDANKKPLTFTWVVLRGEKERIHIKPLNEAGSVVELRVPFHPRRPVEGAPFAIESNRVDIGAFVNNGSYYSAPGFVTFFSQDHEARTYDAEGRLLEVGYGSGETELEITDYAPLFDLMQEEDKGLAGRLLNDVLSAKVREGLLKVNVEYREANAAKLAAEATSKAAQAVRDKAGQTVKMTEERLKVAEKAHQEKPSDETRQAVEQAKKDHDAAAEALKKSEAEYLAVRKVFDDANRAVNELVTQKQPGLEAPVKELVLGALNRAKDDPSFYLKYRAALDDLADKAPATKDRLAAVRKRLTAFGILVPIETRWELHSAQAGNSPVVDRLTRYEREQLQRYHAELLAALLYSKALRATYHTNLVDQRLATAKDWRDLYHYDGAGHLLGWTRQTLGGETEYTADGHRILQTDLLGRALTVRSVKYEAPGKGPEIRTLKILPGDRVFTYRYTDEKDRKGTIVREEKK
jgi:hypothetical protein